MVVVFRGIIIMTRILNIANLLYGRLECSDTILQVEASSYFQRNFSLRIYVFICICIYVFLYEFLSIY